MSNPGVPHLTVVFPPPGQIDIVADIMCNGLLLSTSCSQGAFLCLLVCCDVNLHCCMFGQLQMPRGGTARDVLQ